MVRVRLSNVEAPNKEINDQINKLEFQGSARIHAKIQKVLLLYLLNQASADCM